MNDNTRNIQLSDIKIKDRKRQLKQDKVKELAGSIKQSGLINPITLDGDLNLLAGLHRVEAVKLLGWETIPAVVKAGLDALEAELIEIDENLIRNELSVLQQGEWLVRRDKVLEGMGSRAQVGWNGNQYTNNLGGGDSPPPKTTKDIASEIGMSETTAKRRKQIARDIIPEVKEQIYGTELEERTTDLLHIARIKDPEEQADMVNRMVKTGRTLTQVKHDIATGKVKRNLEDIQAMEVKAVQGLYDVIVIDPPWKVRKINRDVRPNQTDFDYPTMTIDEIADLDIPHTDDCHLFLWTTHKYLPASFDILRRWEAKYICTFVWHKAGGYQPFGLPQYNCEFCLYARWGSPRFVDLSDFKLCFEDGRMGHSKKPDRFYDTLMRVTAGRRLDMFNRRKIDGFDGWGKETV